MDNAFNPDNTHLWARCKAHETSAIRPEYCIFVENCDDCQQNCFHDSDETMIIHAWELACKNR